MTETTGKSEAQRRLINGQIFKELSKSGFVAHCVALAWPQVGANRKNRLIAGLGIFFSFEDGL